MSFFLLTAINPADSDTGTGAALPTLPPAAVVGDTDFFDCPHWQWTPGARIVTPGDGGLPPGGYRVQGQSGCGCRITILGRDLTGTGPGNDPITMPGERAGAAVVSGAWGFAYIQPVVNGQYGANGPMIFVGPNLWMWETQGWGVLSNSVLGAPLPTIVGGGDGLTGWAQLTRATRSPFRLYLARMDGQTTNYGNNTWMGTLWVLFNRQDDQNYWLWQEDVLFMDQDAFPSRGTIWQIAGGVAKQVAQDEQSLVADVYGLPANYAGTVYAPEWDWETYPLRALVVDQCRLRLQYGSYPYLDNTGQPISQNLPNAEPECGTLTTTIDSLSANFGFQLVDPRIWIGYTLPAPSADNHFQPPGPIAFAYGLYCPHCSCQGTYTPG
jgi:hypothetical protein